MPQDVSKDPRILMVEYVLKILEDLTVNKKYKLPASKEKTLEAIKKINSSIKTIKFSYISPLDLADDPMVKEFDLMVNQFWDAILKNIKELEKNKLSAAEIRFIFNILRGFRNRLKLGNEVPLEQAIDVIAVKVISVTKIDTKENLKLCRVGDGERIINVITNLTDIKKGIVVPAAILRPREFGSEVSEAMFCSGKNLSEMQDKVGERIKNLSESSLKEVKRHIMNLLKKN
ncbi:MAG: hypothetical protein ACTSO9_21525 [Candidatus Helarchaeota archaeon]